MFCTPKTLNDRLLDGSVKIGSVRVETKLAECSFGASYTGVHVGLDVPVTIRTLNPKIKSEMADFPRFMQETRKLGRLRHSSLAGLLDVGEILDHPYIVVESVQGVPLIERIKSRPLSEVQALQLLLPVAEGLVELWRKGFVHRSVSPHLIHIQPDGGAKLDMTLLSGQYADPVLKGYMTHCLSPYWSPEEISGAPTGPASDMWSFGAVMYHAVTGQKPVSDVANIQADLHEAMRELLTKLLAPVAADRFATAEDFLTALKNTDNRISRRAEPIKTQMTPAPDFSHVSPLRSFDVGDIIGNVRLVKRLGNGAFGVVYLGRHLTLEIDVAVKLLPPELAMMDPNYVDMFLREARVAARLRHPNVIGIFEAGIQNHQHYLIMEFAPGGSVWDRMFLFGGKLPVLEVLQVLWDTAQGLSAAELLNIVHRDIKPDNLMYSADGSIKIADLGLAKRFIPEGFRGKVSASVAMDQLSLGGDAGTMSGTPAYMAPEIAMKPDSADTRSDLYSLGITAYQMLTGSLPFEGKTSIETIMKHVQQEPVAPRLLNPNISEALNASIMKLLFKAPEDRYQSAQHFIRDLETMHTSHLAAA
jgi:serine/threonine protein kinase